MENLRTQLTKIAYDVPELQPYLVPLLQRKASWPRFGPRPELSPAQRAKEAKELRATMKKQIKERARLNKLLFKPLMAKYDGKATPQQLQDVEDLERAIESETRDAHDTAEELVALLLPTATGALLDEMEHLKRLIDDYNV